MDDDDRAEDWLCSKESQVSAHYLVHRCGRIVRMVPEARRAWHAGVGAWGGSGDVNTHSVGIEICNTGRMPFAAVQMDAVGRLVRDVMSRWDIPPHGVIGHSDCAPGRKIDPGPRFDWARLARQGLAAPTPDGTGEGDLRAAMRRAGYTAEATDDAMLASLRMRHRPWADGPIDARDIGIAQGLAGQAAIDPVMRSA